MVPAGMRNIISDMIRDGYIDILVTTGANMVHDLIEAVGGCHTSGAEQVNDFELRNRHINRIYDVYLEDSCFETLESRLQGIYGGLDPGKTYSIREVLTEIGKNLDDKRSILRTAYECDVPVYCPAIQDSIIGLQAWLYNQTGRMHVDAFKDMRELMDRCYDAKRTGALLIGGGVPKNYILQVYAGDAQTGLRLCRPDHHGPGGDRRPVGCHARRGPELGQGRRELEDGTGVLRRYDRPAPYGGGRERAPPKEIMVISWLITCT